MFYYFKILHLFVYVSRQAHAKDHTWRREDHSWDFSSLHCAGPGGGTETWLTVPLFTWHLSRHHTGSVPSTTLSRDSCSTRAVK